MLRFDIGAIPEGSSHLNLKADASDLEVALDEGRIFGQVQLDVDVTRTGDDILLKGRAKVGAVLECGRCLDEYEMLLEAPIEIWCIVGGKEEGAEQDRDNVLLLAGGARYADLTDYVRSELLVLVPLKPLCRGGCKGLCPICGVNLNSDRCSCHRDVHDSRWDALKKIK
jgi:uncharacterized protein